MKIFTVVGARPQFIKAAPLSKALREAGHQEFLVHTGQHYDAKMSQIFFDEMGIPEPNVNLEIGSGNHGWQTGRMLIGIEELLMKEKPDYTLVYGDTNSTLAGALAATKLHIPLVHVEAGLRSFNREMPEEHNRVLTDHLADLLFCPTQTAVENLKRENLVHGVHDVGDLMYDAVLQFAEIAEKRSTILDDLYLKSAEYFLLTLHRASNTDTGDNLKNVFSVLADSGELIVFPIHPRTQAKINEIGIEMDTYPNIKVIEPLGYLDMLILEKKAKKIITDSGGVQKEAFFFSVPCITLRSETEWVETLKNNWNQVVGLAREKIITALQQTPSLPQLSPLFGNGRSAYTIVDILGKHE